MANEFKHKSVGTELTQTEFEAVGGHVLDSQARGDIIYASSTTQLTAGCWRCGCCSYLGRYGPCLGYNVESDRTSYPGK